MNVICLIGTSRCGSTVLQAALSQFADVTALGEVKRLAALALRRAPCACGDPIPDCEVWGPRAPDFVAPPGGHLRMLVNAMAVATGRSLLPSEASAATSLRDMLQSIGNQIPTRVFVDSSKDPDQLLLYAASPDINVVPVHIVRDPRGVAQSADRRTGTTAAVMTRHWYKLNAATMVLRKMTPRLPWQTIRYEDFCAAPAAICQSILRAAGHDGAMRAEPAKDHTLGGSPGFSFAGINTIRLEDKWRTTMPQTMQAEILRQSGWPARHFGYRLSGG